MNSEDLFSTAKFSKQITIDPNFKIPLDLMNFSLPTFNALKSKGFEEMTPVQSQSFNDVFEGLDVVARSRTGTGKTYAFGLPLIELLAANKRTRCAIPQVIVLEPTRELAIQVAQELNLVCKEHGMKVASIYGGTSFQDQVNVIRNGLNFVVATPGRLLDHISRGTIELGAVQHVVLDEGDTMLEMGFQAAVESILMNVRQPGELALQQAKNALEKVDSSHVSAGSSSSMRRDVQILLFSATMPSWITSLTQKHMTDPVFLNAVPAGETRLASTISHYVLSVPSSSSSGGRRGALSDVLEPLIQAHSGGGQTIVFTNTKDEADALYSSGDFGGLRIQVLHGDISQSSRQHTIRAFKEGKIDVLLATDVAARGLDIAGVELVVHLNPPLDIDAYVHRSGRTGRAGRLGKSILITSSSYLDTNRRVTLEKALNFKFSPIWMPSTRAIVESAMPGVHRQLDAVSSELVHHFLPLVRTQLAESPDVSPLAKAEDLLARSFAVLSRLKSVTHRSLLTGVEDCMTLQILSGVPPGSPLLDAKRMLERSLETLFQIPGSVQITTISRAKIGSSTSYFVDVSASVGLKIVTSNRMLDPTSDVHVSWPHQLHTNCTVVETWSEAGRMLDESSSPHSRRHTDSSPYRPRYGQGHQARQTYRSSGPSYNKKYSMDGKRFQSEGNNYGGRR